MIRFILLMAVLLGCFSLFYWLRRKGMLSKAIKEGKIPQGKATMFDVRRLLMEGKKDLAIEVYAEIFKTSPFQSRKDVEELERSLKV